MVKWPKASDTASYKQFDTEVAKLSSRLKGCAEDKLDKLAALVYKEGLERFGLEKEPSPTEKRKGGPSRKERKIAAIRKDKKKLKTRWDNAPPEEREGLKTLYEDAKKRHRQILRDQRKLERKKERTKCRREFIQDPYKYTKGLFTESKSGRLECTREELEEHLKDTYSDKTKEAELPDMKGFRRPTAPGAQFDMSDIKKKEVDDFVKKARAKSKPGNDGITYKVYKQCPKLRMRLFLLIREMWRAKDVADRWCIAEGIYLPKEEDSKLLGQFRPISLLNIDGKIMFGVISNRIIKFVQTNGYIDESAQKAGVPGIPGCIEHAYSIWETLQKAKTEKEDISMIWLDLANAYGSVPHKLIQATMDFFWIPRSVQTVLLKYYNRFKMRFTTGEFTTEWQRLEVGVAAGCTISGILFVLVMEMMLRSTKCDSALVRTPLRAFMDDITVVSTNVKGTREILGRLDELVKWSGMKFKAKKSRSVTIIRGRQREIRYTIGGDNIPTVKEEPVKSLGRWYKGTLTDRGQGIEIQKAAEEGIRSIDRTALPGKFKCWCLQFGLYPRLMWPLTIYEVALSRVEIIESRISKYIRKWLGLPKPLNNSAIYGKTGQLQLPIASLVEEYKAAQVRTVMTLRYSNDPAIQEDPPEVRSGRKWNAEETTTHAIECLQHADIVGSVQETREGLGTNNFKPFCLSTKKEQREAVVREVRKGESEKRRLHLVNCAVQGQCMRWEECVVARKITWKEIWAWEPARTSFLIKSTYDALPSPANLTRWQVKGDINCRCGKKGTTKHILSNCRLGLNRYTWRHDQVLAVLDAAFKRKVSQFNLGDLPKVEKPGKIAFHKAGSSSIAKSTKSFTIDQRWKGKWEITADLESFLVFPLVSTQQRPDIVIWNTEEKVGIVLELTVPWEENIKDAEHRKHIRYEELIETCEESGWHTEYHHLAIGARGFIGRTLINLLKHRFRFTPTELRQVTTEAQQTVEKASLWIWLKREDSTWLE